MPSTWNVAEDLKNIGSDMRIEAHLMMEHPEKVIKDWTEVADRILVHYEATNDLATIISAISYTPCKFGVVLNLETPVDVLNDYSPNLVYIQLMSIAETGYGGKKLDEKVYQKITTLRNIWPNVRISVDGGVNLDNALKLIAAGVDHLIIGSAIWERHDIEATIKKFQNLST